MMLARLCASLSLFIAVSAGVLAGDDASIRARALVPTAGRPHGEIRLAVSDRGVVVQTVLHSRVLRRVVGRIADKERSGWPPDSAGREDAERYVAALADAVDRLRAAGPPAADRYRSLCIEFFPPQDAGRVVISGARVEASPDGLRLIEKTEPEIALDVSAEYSGRNRRLIVADAFGLDEAAAADLLDEAGLHRAGSD